MNKKFLDKIVQYLVEDTNIDYNEKIIYYPFIPDIHHNVHFIKLGYNRSHPYNCLKFKKYCIDNFGLTEVEFYLVEDKYIEALTDKINNYE